MSCIRYSETTPSMSPVQANQNSMSTSYQPGTMSPMLPRCRKSVRMYGALGKKTSHTSAATTMST